MAILLTGTTIGGHSAIHAGNLATHGIVTTSNIGSYAITSIPTSFSSITVTSSFDTASNDIYASMRVIRNNSAITDGMYIGYGNSGSGITRIFGGGSTGGALEKYATYTYEPGSFRAPIFYDANDTTYYFNGDSTTSLRTHGSWRADSSNWDGEYSGKIQYHSNHWYFQSGNLWIFRNAGGSNVFQVDQSGNGTFSSDIYLGVRGTWLSSYLNQDVRTTASPSFSTVNLNTLNASDTNARYYVQSTNGVPSNNLGNPTVTEMALFDEQFNNKTAFYNPASLTFWTSSDGTNYTEYTGFDTTTKKRFLGGDNDSGVVIPNQTNRFRIEVENSAGYVFLNQLYIYWSSNSHSTKVHIWVRRCDNNQWYQWTDSNAQVSSWPGHLYLPFGGIPFYPGYLASTGHYNRIRIEFIPTWSTGDYSTYPINLMRMQIWGGYPAGKRNIYSTDENQNVSFPAILSATTFSGALSGNATTATTAGALSSMNISQFTNNSGYITGYTETDTLNSVTGRGNTTSNSVRFGTHVDLSPTGSAFRFYDGSTFRGGFGLDSWGHAGSDANLVLYVNGDNTLFFSTAGTKRASLSSSAFNSLVALQQSGNQVLHAGNYTSYSPSLTGSGASGTWGINVTGTAARATRANGNFYIDDNYGNSIVGLYNSTILQGVFAMGDSYKLTAGGGAGNLYGLAWSHPNAGGVASNLNTHGLLVMENGTFLAAISGSIRARDDMRAPIFYDSVDTNYYLDPNSTSVLNRVYTTGRIEVTYNTDRYQMNFLRSSGSNWWVTNDSDKLGLHLNNVGDRIYFATDGNIWSAYYNDWLSNVLANKQNSSTAITTSNIGSQSVNYATTAGALSSMNISQFSNNSGYFVSSTANTVSVNQIAFSTTNYNFSLAPRESIGSMSIKLWDNYFNSSGLGVDYGSLLDIYGRGGHVHSQFYMDAGGGLFYRMSPYASGWTSWASIWTSSSLTNLNQLTNGPGYITSSALSGYATQSYVNSQGFLTSVPAQSQLISPNGATVVAADSAMPNAGHSFIHSLALGPGGNDGHILGMSWAGTNSVYGAQIFIDTDPNDIMAIRSRSSAGVWTSWKTVYHNGNFTDNSSNWNTAYSWGNHASAGYLTSLPSHNHDDRYYTESESDGRYIQYGSLSNSFGLNDNKLYLRTNGDTNHYLWNAADDWEELVYYSGTGFRVKGSTGTVPSYFTENGIYASAYRGKDNVAGTGEASYHPAGVYSTGTNWLYGTMYVNGNSINDAGYLGTIGTNTTPINITGASHKYLTINPGNGYEAMVRYIGGSGSSWYVGKRVTSQVVGTESFHFYSEAAGATVGGVDTSGNIFASGSFRAPIFYDSQDTNYYLDPNSTSRLVTVNADLLRSYGNVYTDGNYGYGLVGLYSAERYQGVFAMGDAYKLAANGTSPGSLYGIAWTHTNVGGQSKSGLGHQALFMMNGQTYTAIGSGIWTDGTITTTSHGTSANWIAAYNWGNHASADYIVKGTQILSSASWPTATRFGSVGDISQEAGNHALSVRSENNNDAFMSFHIGGDYAVHFGLDRVSNRMSVGGWSDGAAKYQLWDSRDFTSSNISNWSTAYSWGNHASAGYQSASTAINTSNIGSQSVSYASTAGSAPANGGNSSTVGGYSVSVAGTANTIPTRNSSGYLIPENWIQLNGNYGLYSPTNNAHLKPNDGSYGSWMMTGSRNSWQGIEFNSGNSGNVTLMINVSSNTVGFHNNSYGWQFLWESGTLYCFKNAYGGGTQATVLDSSNYSSWAQPIASAINTGNIGSQSVSYATSAQVLSSTNYIIQRGSNGSWNADFQATPAGSLSYGGDLGANGTNGPGGSWWIQQNFRHTNASNYWGTQVAWGWEDNANRLATRNITGGSYGAWVYYLNSSNFTTYAPSLTGSGASGTWGISVTGNAATVGGYAVSGSVGANTVVIRDSNGYIYAHYINSNVSESENPTINSFYTSNGDGWLRKSSVAHVKSQLGLGSMAYESSGTYQTVSGAINTGNIGSQSVSYATVSQQLNKFGDIYGQDWNSYYINGKMIVSSVYGGSGPNFPTGAYNYGAMLSYGVTGSDFFQVYFPENGALQGGAFRKLHYRTGWNGSWSAWKSVVDQEGQVCTIAGSNQTGIEIHSNVGYNQDPLTYFLMRGQADNSWKAFKVRLTGDAGGQDIEFRRIAENGADARMWYVPRGANTVNFEYPIVQPSDSRLKDNITPISTPVDKIKSLRGVEFDWNSGEQVGTHDVGLIAQDVEAVLPEAVTTQEDGYKNLAYTKVIPLLVEAMKEQQAMIEALKAEIELLKNK